ncbi:MAG: hypothetical protein JWO88_3530 [Frankiales bacterium]|nr:hypothetical protein [Frankiales bacterium]
MDGDRFVDIRSLEHCILRAIKWLRGSNARLPKQVAAGVFALSLLDIQAAEIKTYKIEVPAAPGSIHWIDDHRIAAIAVVKKTALPAEPDLDQRVRRLAILDVALNQVTWGDEFSGELCAKGETIAYFTKQEVIQPTGIAERFWLSHGSIGHVVKREVTREALEDRVFDFQHNCRSIAELPALPIVHEGKRLQRLRVEDGVVEWQISRGHPTDPQYPITFYSYDPRRAPVKLDVFQGRDIAPQWPFFKFKDAYWITEQLRRYPVTPPGSYRSWWLYRDGRVESAIEFDLSATFDGHHAWTPKIPTKDGFLTTADRGRRYPVLGNLGNSGLYRFNVNGKHERLLAGTVRPWAVSPNGCQIAVGNDPRRDDAGQEHLFINVLDVCRRR